MATPPTDSVLESFESTRRLMGNEIRRDWVSDLIPSGLPVVELIEREFLSVVVVLFCRRGLCGRPVGQEGCPRRASAGMAAQPWIHIGHSWAMGSVPAGTPGCTDVPNRYTCGGGPGADDLIIKMLMRE